MTNEERYERIRECLQNKLNAGVITEESANAINDIAWDKYMTESKKDDVAELLDKVKDGVENGSITLDDDTVKALKALIPADGGDDNSDAAGDDEGDDDTDEESCKESCKKENCKDVKEAVQIIDNFLNSLIED